MGLSDAQAEHEGRGYVHSDDVVNAGFLQGETSHVAVQVVYDELAVRDDLRGRRLTPITRELRPKEPLALNLMRITVDGQPIDDPGRSLADIQRCTDVALEKADIQFRFDDLESDPRLSVTSQPIAVPVAAEDAQRVGRSASACTPTTRTSSSARRSGSSSRRSRSRPSRWRSSRSDANGLAQWQPAPEWFEGPVRELKYVLRATTREGHFDETAPQSLWMIHGKPDAASETDAAARRLRRGRAARPATSRSAASAPSRCTAAASRRSTRCGWPGRPVPGGRARQLRGRGDPAVGRCTRSRWPCSIRRATASCSCATSSSRASDWFYVGMADLTMSPNLGGGPPDALIGEDAPYDHDSLARRTARLLPDRQVRRGLEAHRERRHARGAGRGPVQQLPRQVAGVAVPADRSRLLTTRPSATTARSRRPRRPRASSSPS